MTRYEGVYQIAGTFFRRDNDGGPSLFLADIDDTSPEHLTHPTGYDYLCTCCWLHFPHSETRHTTAVQEARRLLCLAPTA